MLKHNASKLLEKEMDRRDFLKHVGLAVIALSGVSAVLKVLSDQPTAKKMQSQAGYGSSVYGGIKK